MIAVYTHDIIKYHIYVKYYVIHKALKNMIERWKRDSLTALRSAIEKFNSSKEGDFKQALELADHASETIMRNFIIFENGSGDPPYGYPDLFEEICKKVDIPPKIVETTKTFHLVRDGFRHHNIKQISKGLRGTTTGLTLEKSYLEEYLQTICELFKLIADVDIEIGSESNDSRE